MLVWINGAFGAGKTHTAHELARRVHGAVVSDPEEPGFGIHRMLPPELRGDFQDHPAWRVVVRETLAGLDADGRWPVVVVPMTLVDPVYREEIFGWLRGRGHSVVHVALVVPPEVLRARLRRRVRALGGIRPDTWALAQVDRCTAALAELPDMERLDAAELSLDEVVEAVAARARLPLDQPRLSKARRRAQWVRVSLGAVRR